LERGYTTAGSLGLGFSLMHSVADRVYLFTRPSGTTVVLEQGAVPESQEETRFQFAFL
jgi:anti-sigma regulatory factor (Ser/Thr protein kinase)